MSLTLSVIIPVRNASGYLRACLEHVRSSVVRPLECIVIDDASTDDSAQVARDFGAKLMTTEHRGPAAARNLGARAAKGDILFFLDADVCVYPETFALALDHFAGNGKVDAVIGSYDDTPRSQNFLSQYKNLMQCFVHQQAHSEASTFWSGCGAIRRTLFLEQGGFDENYARPAIEDIELGYRLTLAGRKIILDKQLVVKHLKRWTFWKLLKTDIFDRGIPWTELILRDRFMPNDLNLRFSERVSVALVFILFGLAVEGTIRYQGYFLTPFVGLLIFMLSKYWMTDMSQPRSKGVTAFMAGLVGAFLWLAFKHQMLPMAPPVLLGCALLFLHTRRWRRMTALAYAVYLFFAAVFISTFLPRKPLVFGVYVVLLGLIVLNRHFYAFFGAKHGRFSAIAVIPFHLLYHFYNGIAFAVGACQYAWHRIFPLPPPKHAGTQALVPPPRALFNILLMSPKKNPRCK